MNPRLWLNLLIGSILALILIDALPPAWFHHQPLRRAVDPILDVTGLWQGGWTLFAPEVDRENNWIEIAMHRRGGEPPLIWRSPDWARLNPPQKFRRVREIEYYDRIRLPRNAAAWPELVRHAREQLAPETPDDVFAKIELISATRPIASPGAGIEAEVRREVFHAQP